MVLGPFNMPLRYAATVASCSKYPRISKRNSIRFWSGQLNDFAASTVPHVGEKTQDSSFPDSGTGSTLDPHPEDNGNSKGQRKDPCLDNVPEVWVAGLIPAFPSPACALSSARREPLRTKHAICHRRGVNRSCHFFLLVKQRVLLIRYFHTPNIFSIFHARNFELPDINRQLRLTPTYLPLPRSFLSTLLLPLRTETVRRPSHCHSPRARAQLHSPRLLCWRRLDHDSGAPMSRHCQCSPPPLHSSTGGPCSPLQDFENPEPKLSNP